MASSRQPRGLRRRSSRWQMARAWRIGGQGMANKAKALAKASSLGCPGVAAPFACAPANGRRTAHGLDSKRARLLQRRLDVVEVMLACLPTA